MRPKWWQKAGWLIIGLTLLVEVPRFMEVNWKIEGVEQNFGTLIGFFTGMGMGGCMALGVAYVFHGWQMAREVDADSRQAQTLGKLFVALVFVEGVMITPYIQAGVSERHMTAAIGGGFFSWVWAAIVSLAAVLVIAGVAQAIDAGAELASQVAGEVAQIELVKLDEVAQVELVEVEPEVVAKVIKPCPYCVQDNFTSPQQRGGHMGRCPQKPASEIISTNGVAHKEH